jgi:hypothetical protein
MIRLISIPIVAGMIGMIIDTNALGIAITVSADGKHVELSGITARQSLTPSEALQLADWLAHAAREAQINEVEDIIDGNTRWV